MKEVQIYVCKVFAQKDTPLNYTTFFVAVRKPTGSGVLINGRRFDKRIHKEADERLLMNTPNFRKEK